MAGRKSFIVFCDRINELEMLTDEECGKLFKGIVHYASEGVEFEADSLPLKLMFSVFKSQIDNNSEKYQKRKETNAKYYKKSKESKTISENSDELRILKNLKTNSAGDTDTVTDTVTDTDIVTVTDIVTDTGTDTVCQSPPSPPSPSAPSRSPLEALIYDYGEENAEKYLQRVESWYAEKGKPLTDAEAVARKWMEQDNVAAIDHSMDKYKCLINKF